MSIFAWVVLITAIAGVGGTGVGAVVCCCFRKDSKKTVSLLLSFAGGVMLSVVCFDLIMETLFPPGSAEPSNLILAIIGILIGYGVVALLNYLIDYKTNPEVPHVDSCHPKTADDLDELIHSNHLQVHMDRNSELFVAGIIMASAIALHNFPEGMIIGAAYAGDAASSLWDGSGWIVALIIGIHNVPEGMAVAVPLMAGGMRKSKAIAITAASGVPTVLGAIAGYMLGSISPLWHAISLSFASGAMLYVVFGELLPESILMWRSKLPAASLIFGMLLGLVLIYG
ncbi:MAG: ZIP family metal transporter [Bacillota bacterium]|nr:ZIP family metal transporter [Eubacteriales bacterium]MDD3537297.1 ZIP family metal transporter [Eubacteriales bacterium]MDD4286223.1 ZIP family metal transporter [Eubacteriales bacterium]MDI9492674.1 ZIP family metal transporter [Bacillota bacterium]HPF19514.1 ZIP family metal transporter [Bacillota bacterium]